MNTINPESTLGAIVTAFPATARLFQSLKIDFCCGGDRSFADAVQDLELDADMLWQQVQTVASRPADSSQPDYQSWTADHLASYIEEKHHSYMREQLPLIADRLFKVLKAHGERHPELFQVHRLFGQLRPELEQHLVKEETRLFPALQDPDERNDQEPAARIARLVDELRHEHETAGSILHELREVTRDYTVPEDGCTTYHLVWRDLSGMETDLFQHIHLENNVLFPRLLQPEACACQRTEANA